MSNGISSMSCSRLRKEYPSIEVFFASISLDLPDDDRTVIEYLRSLPYIALDPSGMSVEEIIDGIEKYIRGVDRLQQDRPLSINILTILGGHGKSGEPEYPRIDIHAGEILSIVGKTGSGKSQLLADIESMAQADTPTGRTILLDGNVPSEEMRFGNGKKLVTQLSQNMNFVMDMSVREFIKLHAECRMAGEVKVNEVLVCANDLSGEQFSPDTPLTALSGGQSRALMIADTAILGDSPVVLIDEIENAGVDRRMALDTLIQKGKIVLIATHDPALAIMGNRRIIIQNGGISNVIETTSEEKELLTTLNALEDNIMHLRSMLRDGKQIPGSAVVAFRDFPKSI